MNDPLIILFGFALLLIGIMASANWPPQEEAEAPSEEKP
jgi:hypothetical protein